jgi:hypothetical protein
MSEDAHIIEIDSIVLDGIDPHRPGVRALVEAETRRALLRVGPLPLHDVPGIEAAVAAEVARAVDQAGRGGARET